MSKRCISCKAQLTDTSKRYCSVCEWKECRTNRSHYKKGNVITAVKLFTLTRHNVQRTRMVRKNTVGI
jgi:uncharacterized Fe-S radical SAM superfamily protein PflX